MKESTINAIATLLTADGEVTPELRQTILRACRGTASGRRMILAKEAMAILGISRPTLRGLVQRGRLHQVKATPRKTRFDLAEVETLATTPEVL